MSSLRIQRIGTLSELDGLKERWLALERLDGGPSIFQSWLWHRIWCDEVLPHRPHGRLDVRIIEDGAGRTLAILPLFTEWLAGPAAWVTQFLGHRMSFHNDMLLAEPTNAELARSVVQMLLSDLGPATVLHLRDLSAESLITQSLLTRGDAEPQAPRLYLEADPAITDQHLRFGPSRRKAIRKAERRLQARWTMEFRVYTGTNIDKAFDELINLHVKRFVSERRATSLTGPNLAFLRSASVTLGRAGKIEVLQLLADGVTIAALLMAVDHGRYFAIQSGFDPEFAYFSPLVILYTEAIRRGFEDLDCTDFDFGPGYGAYKYFWSPAVGTNYMCCRGGAGPYAKSLAALYRRAFRSRLPPVPNIRDEKVVPGGEERRKLPPISSVAT